MVRVKLLVLVLFSAMFTGCFAEREESGLDYKLLIDSEEQIVAERGQYTTISVFSSHPWIVNAGPGIFVQDEFGVHRDADNVTLPTSLETLTFLSVDTELESSWLNIALEDGTQEQINVSFTDSTSFMLVDGERAFDTIDMLTTDHNNRWCASASIHEGGANYAASAEAMKDWMLEMGFDHAEVTDYPDDPDQKNVVGYNYGRLYPDEYIIIGGHFDVGYAFTPPGGGTSEGANDDTSGSTVSLEMAHALANMEFDHTVVSALWACEEEGLLGSLAYVANLPENVSVKAYMNFDMVSLNYPIVPPPGYGPYDLSISIAGASDENMTRMIDWVAITVEDDLSFSDTPANDIFWQKAESCASDHCAFFNEGYPTFNFFSAGGDASFWQEWHSVSDNLDFMIAKAGGEEELASGFNTLTWIALNLFIHVDNTGSDFQGTWVES